MANNPQELAQDVVCQSHTGHMTGLCFLPSPAFKADYYPLLPRPLGHIYLPQQHILEKPQPMFLPAVTC